jgi:hypothetical protein
MERLRREYTADELKALQQGDAGVMAQSRALHVYAVEQALRQWSVEQAVKVFAGITVPPPSGGNTNVAFDVAGVARGIFNFVNEARDAKEST